MKELADRGATFKLSLSGGRATNGRSVWWLRDYPEQRKEEPKPEPAVTQEQLDELEPGDIVFRKALSYGRIIDLDDSYIEVTFDSDDKKKPSRNSCSRARSSRDCCRLDRWALLPIGLTWRH